LSKINKMKKYLKFSVVLRAVSIIMLFWTFSDNPYGYYILLRWVVCATSIYCFYIASEKGKNEWMWVFGFFALLFNPIVPLHMSREIWLFLDVIAGISFLISLFGKIGLIEDSKRKEITESSIKTKPESITENKT